LDGSRNELWTDTSQTRFLTFEDGRRIYRTPETVDPIDGKVCTYQVTFERVQIRSCSTLSLKLIQYWYAAACGAHAPAPDQDVAAPPPASQSKARPSLHGLQDSARSSVLDEADDLQLGPIPGRR
jgi:hypothetical protein